MPVKVIIIEQFDALRINLEKAFAADPFFHVLSSGNSFPFHWGSLSVESPDILIIDADLPEKEVIDFLRSAVSALPHASSMIMVQSHENGTICSAFRYGVCGFLLKSTASDQVVEAARDLYHGGAPMSPLIAKKLMNAFQHTIRIPTQTSHLSQREREILILLSEGLQYKEIAARLLISPYTVRQHLHNVYSKLEVQNKVEAINKGLGLED